ncbi:MAG TPA: hypothetical protein VGO47_01170 [Chlamydiales bacterium]|nr:hypothetical protein [Chlamydiales bacterium]
MHAPINTDMDAYRRVVRHAVLSLPLTDDVGEDWVWKRPEAVRYIPWRDKHRQVLWERPWLTMGFPRTYKRSMENPLGLDSVPEPVPLT